MTNRLKPLERVGAVGVFYKRRRARNAAKENEKMKLTLTKAMKMAIDYFEQHKPDGAEIRGCTPWEMYGSTGDLKQARIRIEYCTRDERGETDYTESDAAPLVINVYRSEIDGTIKAVAQMRY